MQRFSFSSYMVICLVLFSERGFSQSFVCSSPDKKIWVSLKPGNNCASLFTYTLTRDGNPAIANASLGVVLNGANPSLKATLVNRPPVRSSWETVYGERKQVADNYNSIAINFVGGNNAAISILVECRLYNEGMAYRYTIENKAQPIVLKEERGLTPIASGAYAWVSNTAQGLISKTTINAIREEVERPLTIKLDSVHWMAMGEAGLTDFARMKFTGNEKNELVTRLSGTVNAHNRISSPWRYCMLAGSPAQLLQQNYFILNLNEPCRIRETAWIKPGKVLRETTLTTNGSYASIDFAAAHHIQYICFDAGWYGREDHDTSDATRVAVDPLRSKGPLNLQEVIRYGNAKNVGVLLYVNRRALERQLDTLLPLYEKWGVKGIKFGFVQVGSQEWTSWLHEAIRKAASHHMLVDIHDEYRPTGYTRTYPNLLTQEGIRGDEESPFTEQTIKTLFTRMIAGPADNTNCYFTERVNKMGSHAAQLAKSVCIYSPLNFLYWYDHPSTDTIRSIREGVIQEVPELDWFNKLPVVWDETCVLEGDMEAFATIARKKDNAWFIGALNGTTARTAVIRCSFLDKGKKYKAVICEDDPSEASSTHVRITSRELIKEDTLNLHLDARNGFALMISPL